ncbi:MAG: lysylphosphatidylglycerol synthase transmembrane domain-containing protein [Desulfurivibrio sp.]|nr:lysylphosphatidylglycerol synthase transmembrane domain-containing protein [Desulfurivibrio sp.]
MKRNLRISLVVGVLLSLLGFYFVFKNVPFANLAASLSGLHYRWLAAGGAVGLFSFVVRAFRWQLILGSSWQLPFAAAYHPLMIAFMLNTILPGRLGELARPVIIKKRHGVPFTLGMTTVVTERLFDIIMLVVLFAGLLTLVPIDPELEISFRHWQLDRQLLETLFQGVSRACMGIAVVLVIVSVPAVQRGLKSLVLAAPGRILGRRPALADRLAARVARPLATMIDHIGAGLSMIHRPLHLALCLGYSLVIWLLQGLAIYLATFAFPAVQLGFLPSLTVFIIVCFFIMLPSVPGFWGIWEAGSVFGLALFGIPKDAAVAFSLASHAMLLLPVLIAGLVSAAVTGVKLSSLGRSTIDKPMGNC